jgi:hypothetical protein
MGKGRADQLAHRQVVGKRGAEIAVQEAGDPVPVLNENRLVCSQLVVELVDCGLGGEVSELAPGNVPGKKVRADEDEHAEEEQRDGRETEPGEEESPHRRSYRLGVMRPGPKPRPQRPLRSARVTGLREVELAGRG